jgi:hypothetical protein
VRSRGLVLFISLFLAFTPRAEAGLSCRITQVFDRKELKEDATFWEEIGKLSEQGKLDDASVEELFKKRSIQIREPRAPDTPHPGPERRVGAPRYTMNKQAQKDVAALPPRLRGDLDDFLEAASDGKGGLQALRANQGRWQMKQLKGSSTHSARLNNGYRVGFDVLEDGSIRITGVNNGIGH